MFCVLSILQLVNSELLHRGDNLPVGRETGCASVADKANRVAALKSKVERSEAVWTAREGAQGEAMERLPTSFDPFVVNVSLSTFEVAQENSPEAVIR